MDGDDNTGANPMVEVPPYQIVVQWHPVTHRLDVSWPTADDVILLGMLDMARVLRIELRGQMGAAGEKRVLPATFVPRRAGGGG